MYPFVPHLPTTLSAQPTHQQTLTPPANIALENAIRYASQQELPKLVDRAMKTGATLNCPNCYECNALVIAVRANRPWAIAVLMARGAEPPIAPPNGIDLLMEACRDDHEVVAEALLDVAKMSVHAKDQKGKTALHYAVLAGSGEIVELLLQAGADPNISIPHLDTEEFLSIFAPDHELIGQPVTPLMIATAKGNEAIVVDLLKAEADPHKGPCSPLIIAALNHAPSLFDRLLANGADLRHCRIASGQRGLTACVTSRMPTACLSKLVSQHDFKSDDGTVHSPLGIAVVNNDLPVISLLMSHGAPVEDHEQSDEPLTLWDMCLAGGKSSSTAADLLTSRAPTGVDPDDIEGFSALLELIEKNATKLPVLASGGIFTSLLARCIDRLTELSAHGQWTSLRQCTLAVAWHLQESLPKVTINPEKADPNRPEDVWFELTAQRIRLQRRALLEGSTRLIEHCMEGLHATTTLDFFLGCAADCPEHEDMASFIKHRIAATTGAPDAVIRVVRDAWITAAKWTKDWQVAPDAADEGNRFLLALTGNLMRKALDEFTVDHDEVTNACLEALRQALPIASHELSKFCADPAAWLRQFESRNTLEDPADILVDQVQIALGLPAATCEAIVTEWRNAIRAARTARWNTPAEMQFVLKRHMAMKIAGALHAGEGDEIVPPTARLMLERTRSSVSSPHARAPSRKRTAEAEAPGAPPRKEARDAETS